MNTSMWQGGPSASKPWAAMLAFVPFALAMLPLNAYACLNLRVYVEVGGYGTSRGLASFMSAGLDRVSTTQLRGINPYWRLAFNTEWGPNSLIVGTSGMVARVYDDPLDTSDAASTHRYPATLAPSNATDTNQAQYGASLGVFSLTGTSNTAAQMAGDDATGTLTGTDGAGSNLSGNPASRGWTLETCWLSIQYLRIGAQYTAYSRFNGTTSNCDGLGRNARDNNTFVLYSWLAY